jgi:hypothetical protein
MDKQDKAALTAIGAATLAGTTLGTITVAIVKTTFLGITLSTTTVALPVAGLVAAGGLVTYGGYRVWRALKPRSGPGDNPPGRDGRGNRRCHTSGPGEKQSPESSASR